MEDQIRDSEVEWVDRSDMEPVIKWMERERSGGEVLRATGCVKYFASISFMISREGKFIMYVDRAFG